MDVDEEKRERDRGNAIIAIVSSDWVVHVPEGVREAPVTL